PAGTTNPDVGATDLDGDNAGTDRNMCTGFPDLCDRPLFPALFITDITDEPSSKAGDWQSGIIDPQSGAAAPEAIPVPPDAVFGTWKGAVRTLDKTKNPPLVTVTPDRDPAKNNYNLDGGDTAPTGLTNQGYGAEIVWDVDALTIRALPLGVVLNKGTGRAPGDPPRQGQPPAAPAASHDQPCSSAMLDRTSLGQKNR